MKYDQLRIEDYPVKCTCENCIYFEECKTYIVTDPLPDRGCPSFERGGERMEKIIDLFEVKDGKRAALKDARKSMGLSQSFVASYCRISLTAYQNIENGVTKTPSQETVELIQNLLRR